MRNEPRAATVVASELRLAFGNDRPPSGGVSSRQIGRYVPEGRQRNASTDIRSATLGCYWIAGAGSLARNMITLVAMIQIAQMMNAAKLNALMASLVVATE